MNVLLTYRLLIFEKVLLSITREERGKNRGGTGEGKEMEVRGEGEGNMIW